ncbi:hypothetical protein RRG08_026765 [Elysia crispata]|uniref:Uncharacterized protein n=1 Tax=Elysia crispata TaxID=231223 RepID=A0AAE1ASC2_9GAST|nr:hypothetical protein RRG08_026765 [Elysia crispata]
MKTTDLALGCRPLKSDPPQGLIAKLRNRPGDYKMSTKWTRRCFEVRYTLLSAACGENGPANHIKKEENEINKLF